MAKWLHWSTKGCTWQRDGAISGSATGAKEDLLVSEGRRKKRATSRGDLVVGAKHRGIGAPQLWLLVVKTISLDLITEASLIFVVEILAIARVVGRSSKALKTEVMLDCEVAWPHWIPPQGALSISLVSFGQILPTVVGVLDDGDSGFGSTI